MHNFCLKRSIFIVQHDLKTAYIEHNVNKKKSWRNYKINTKFLDIS